MKALLQIVLLLLVASCVSLGFGAEGPNPAFRVDLAEHAAISQSQIRLVFLTDEILLVSAGERPPSALIFDVTHRKLLRTAVLGSARASDIWPTHDGNFFVRSPDDHLVLFDRDFKEVVRVQIPREATNIQLSPDGRKIAWTYWPSNRSTRTTVLDADTLKTIMEESSTIPPRLASTGLLYENWYYGGDGRVYVKPFSGVGEQVLHRGKPKCLSLAEGVYTDHFLLKTCAHKNPYIVDLAGQPSYEVPAGHFLQTCTSGKSFAMGEQRYSATHFLKNLNLPADLAGVEEYAEEFALRAYESKSGKLVVELKWKLNKNEPMFDRYDNDIIALSPNGQLLATIRGTWLEVYDVPIN
jgi:hypothetical protein